MNQSLETVRNYYDRDPEHEWTRLDRGRFEMPVTMHFLSRYLKPSSSILDVGGGPGRYSFALTGLGHTVDLFDLSAECIALARRKSVESKVALKGYHVGTSTDLTRFPSSSFDSVLCMGPLYHLVDTADREAALGECLRVLKPTGLLVVSFLSSYAHIFDIVCMDPNWIMDVDLGKLVDRCASSSFVNDGFVFTDSYYIEPFEVADFMGRFPVEKITVIGAQGLVGQSQVLLSRTSPEVLERWIELAKATAETNGALGSSVHVTYFGRKK